MVTRYWVESWDPSYAAAAADGTGPAEASSAARNTDVEVPAGSWAPMPYPADLQPPDTVLLVDGVRRTDASVWTDEGDGDSYPGLAVSYAAGVVRCDLRGGEAALVGAQVRRSLFTASPTATDLACGQVRYRVHRVSAGELPQLSAAVQTPLARLETEVAGQARATVDDPGDLLVLDGPLRGRTDLARAVGYVKTHHKRYLPAPLNAVVTALAPGQRSPIFELGTSWGCLTWYLRLAGGSGAPWSGLARLECAADLPVAKAVALADLSVVTLPRFASSAYKDPRAPQNLIPIAGLEQRLRARLGDATVLHRALTRAARAPQAAG
jgi:hypothetical protein